MFRGNHHTAISTPDLARSVAFYRDLFGFEVILEMDWPRGYAGADLIMGIEGTAAQAVMLRRADSMIERKSSRARSARIASVIPEK